MQAKTLIAAFTLTLSSSILIISMSDSNEIKNTPHTTQKTHLNRHNVASSSNNLIKHKNTIAIYDDTISSSESKLTRNCLNELNTANHKLTHHSFSISDQKRISALLDNCVYEIDMELALTESQLTRSAETMPCFNKIYEIRDYLLELGTNAQHFSELPNATDSDRAIITESFTKIFNAIILSAESAMTNRITLCNIRQKTIFPEDKKSRP